MGQLEVFHYCFDPDNDVARKCNLCSERVDQGLVPACADNICLAKCIQFTFTGADDGYNI